MAYDDAIKAWFDRAAARLVGSDEKWWWIKTVTRFVFRVFVVAVCGAMGMIGFGGWLRIALTPRMPITNTDALAGFVGFIFVLMAFGALRLLVRQFREVRAHLEGHD